MSGFEVAGVVLGAFPILYDGAKDLRGFFKDVRSWWRFEREYEDFILDVEKEHIAFSQILEILLDPVDELSQEEKDTLQSDPNSSLWFELRVQSSLIRRVQKKHYGWFMRQLGNINEALEELHQLLPIGKSRQAYHLDSSSLDSELYRIKTSFSHRKDELLSNVRAGNTNLYEFLQKEAHLQRSRNWLSTSVKEAAKATATYLKVQEQARTVFKGFQRHWVCGCNCASGHFCGISAYGNDMKVLFGKDINSKHVTIELQSTQELPEKKASQSAAPLVVAKQVEVTDLRQQVSMKSRFRGLKKGPKSILKLTASTLSVLGKPVSVEANGGSDGLEKPPEKLKKRNRSTGSIPATRVRFDATSPPPDVDLDTQPSIPSFVSNDHSQAINDMCAAIGKECQQPCLGFLELPDTRLFFHLDPPGETHILKMETIEKFMETTPRRDSRLKLGLSIATTILSLGPLWTPESWSKSSLVLLRATHVVPQPYISHPSIHTTLKSAAAAPTKAATRATLLALGILLLELLFRDNLESQPFRETYLGSGGQPNDMTDYCTAVLWQKQVEEEFGDKLADAISRCLKCNFDPAADLSSSAFVQAVWTRVVQPLEEFLKVYSIRA
ncbi:hypothetical protein ACHAPT_006240 [Fusarium lateritium]